MYYWHDTPIEMHFWCLGNELRRQLFSIGQQKNEAMDS